MTFTTDGKAFYANGEKVYENYYANLWYRLRVEADTETQTALIKINGRKVGEVPFAEAATSVDNVFVANNGEAGPKMANFKVFRIYDREDYVPEPVVPKGEDAYIVGMNVCSLWRNNGGHYGWACITPYDDPQPVLGYYDEGLPETADWEIKYLVEHGVDFQAFCVYFGSTSGPQRLNADHLYDGFMNAKYSDMSKFCIIWETANAQSPSSFDAWKNDYVPYFIENFFKDPRHIVIDNKPVLCVFGPGKIAERLGGGNDKVKQCFDYLEEEVKKLGFDGMIYLACGSSSSTLAEMGFDGCYAYNWGTSGNELAVNKNSNLSSAKYDGLYTVPTISVGFNSIPWHGLRYPLMTMEDYKAAHEWVKTEYLPTYAEEKWQWNFVMLSTWNEYGEGTYIMPSTDEKGFGYLDVLREAYTGEKIDESLNTVPNAEQKARINRLYPQYRRLLRKEGWYSESVDTDNLETVKTIDYGTDSSIGTSSVNNVVKDGNGLSGTSGADAILQINDVGEGVNLDEISALRITAKIPAGESMQVFFTTMSSTGLSEDKSKKLTSTTGDMTEYLFVMSDIPLWKGNMVCLRIDPVAPPGVDFTVKSVEFLAAPAKAPKKMTINGLTFDTNFPTQTASNGDVLVAFDPVVGMDYRLNCFHLWDKEAQKLTLNFVKHTIEYTVGSDKYTVDGAEKSLGYKMTSLDGLPLIPIEKLCAELGYTCTMTDGLVSIDTDQKALFDARKERTPGIWNFNTPGDTEGWSSTFMSLLVNDGYMDCDAMSESNDPTILLTPENGMLAAQYKTLKYRVRYDYTAEKLQELTMYFITDKDPNWHESKTLKIKFNDFTSNGEWEEYSFDLADQPLWKDTITKLRFDPFNAVGGAIDVDYIIFEEDPDYVYVDPEDMPFTLINGDAEDVNNPGFVGYSIHGIVEDPDDSNNHCYKFFGTPGKKEWIYAVQPVRFKPGATYKVECDVRLADTRGDEKLADDFKATVLSNAQYNDPAGSKDHIAGRISLTVGDGWQHFSFEFTVNPDSRDRSADKLSLYSDPVGDLGVNWYLDNVEVTEIKPEKAAE